MADLRSCTACGEPITLAARSCWSCGAPAERAKRPRPRVQVPQLPTAPPLLGMAGGALLVVGSFLPWMVAGPFSASGADLSDGWITVILGAIAAFAGYQDRQRPSPGLHTGLLVLGGLAMVVAVFQFRDLSGPFDPGIGLYLVLIGALAVVVGGLLAMRQRR